MSDSLLALQTYASLVIGVYSFGTSNAGFPVKEISGLEHDFIDLGWHNRPVFCHGYMVEANGWPGNDVDVFNGLIIGRVAGSPGLPLIDSLQCLQRKFRLADSE